jgi:hypothetical protein
MRKNHNQTRTSFALEVLPIIRAAKALHDDPKAFLSAVDTLLNTIDAWIHER